VIYNDIDVGGQSTLTSIRALRSNYCEGLNSDQAMQIHRLSE